jgi:hypothetical protein
MPLAQGVPPALTPRVQVLERFAPGFAFLSTEGKMVSEDGKPAQTWATLPAAEAFATVHKTDAHFTCYGVVNDEGALEERIPRLTKGVIPLLEEYQLVRSATQVVGTAVALDYDLPGHGKWSPGHWAEFLRTMAQVTTQRPLLGSPSLWYTTAGGCRFVWFLGQATPVEGAGGLEDLLSGMVAAAHQAGLIVDPACRDWTRIFRLPRVLRRDKPPTEAVTDVQGYFRMSWGRVDPEAIERDPPASILVYRPVDLPRLSAMLVEDFHQPHAQPLLRQWRNRIGVEPHNSRQRLAQVAVGAQPEAGSEHETEKIQYQRLKAIIKSRAKPRSPATKPWGSAIHAFGVLYEGVSLYTDPEALEGLHEGILRLVRAICFTVGSQLGDGPDQINPELLFYQVYYVASRDNRLRGANQRPDAELRNEVWRAITHIYRIFRGSMLERAEAEEAKSLDEAARTQALMSVTSHAATVIREALAGWVRGDSTAITCWRNEVAMNLDRMLVWDCEGQGRSVVCINPDGGVGLTRPTKSDSIFYINIRDAGHALIPYERMTKEGDLTLVPPSKIVSSYGSRANLRYSRKAAEVQTCVEVMRSGRPEVTLLIPAPGIRQNIPAVHNPVVHEWLVALGGAQADKLLDWLAVFGKLDRPAAGLYLQGAPSVGKGMLGLALANMTTHRTYAPFSEALEQFQDTMLHTPFVWADEDTDSSHRVTRGVMNTYKRLVTGEFNSLTGKGDKPISIEGHWRVLLTANTDRLLRWDEDVNEADLGALVQRTIHIHCDSTAALQFLQDIGGVEGTKDWPEIHIPQHIQWLMENRKAQPGKRLCVEGTKTEYHEALSINTGGTDLVVRGLGRMLRDLHKFPGLIYLEGPDGPKRRCFVNTTQLHQCLSHVFQGDTSVKIPTQRKVTSSLKHLCTTAKSVNKRVKLPNQRRTEVLRYHELNLPILLRNLELMEEPVDFREALGPECWRLNMPAGSDSLSIILEDDTKPIQGPTPHRWAPLRPAPSPPSLSS